MGRKVDLMDIFQEFIKAGLFDEDSEVDRQTVVNLLSIINNCDIMDPERIKPLLISTIESFGAQAKLAHLKDA